MVAGTTHITTHPPPAHGDALCITTNHNLSPTTHHRRGVALDDGSPPADVLRQVTQMCAGVSDGGPRVSHFVIYPQGGSLPLHEHGPGAGTKYGDADDLLDSEAVLQRGMERLTIIWRCSQAAESSLVLAKGSAMFGSEARLVVDAGSFILMSRVANGERADGSGNVWRHGVTPPDSPFSR
jgi:hypothetical protein